MINPKRDTHVHTCFSPDADISATFSNYISQAETIGLEEIVFTDHVDFDPAHPLFKTPIDYDKYIKAYEAVQKSASVQTKLGVEIGYQKHVKDKMIDFLNRYPFEHVILSIHYLEQKDLYTREYFTGKTKKEAYQIYFETCIEAVQSIPNFTVFGHLDYITRYSPFGDYDYVEYKDVIDRLLQELIKRNKGIEINTSGYQTEQRCYPKKEVIERYIELGGTIITMSSDAHRVEELGRYFEKNHRL